MAAFWKIYTRMPLPFQSNAKKMKLFLNTFRTMCAHQASTIWSSNKVVSLSEFPVSMRQNKVLSGIKRWQTGEVMKPDCGRWLGSIFNYKSTDRRLLQQGGQTRDKNYSTNYHPTNTAGDRAALTHANILCNQHLWVWTMGNRIHPSPPLNPVNRRNKGRGR